MAESKKSKQFLAASISAGYAYVYGISLGWSNPIEPKAYAGDLGFTVTREEFSWVGSSLSLGAIFACLPTGFQMDKIGRKPSLLSLFIPLAIGWGLTVFAMNSWMLIVARLILGYSIGATCVISPMYNSEVGQKEIRGTLNALFHLYLISGILFVYVIGAFMEPLSMNIICAAHPVLLTLCAFFMPETPLFLIRKARIEDAEKSFRWLRGKDFDPKEEIDIIKDAIVKSNIQEGATYWQSISSRSTRQALSITLVLMIFQQLCGIKIAILYSTEIFRIAESSFEPRYCTIIVGVVQVVATTWAVFCVDKLGRRILLLISAGLMMMSFFAMGLFFFLKEHEPELVRGLGWTSLIALCLFIVAYSIGFGPVTWIVLGEMIPPEVKGRVGSLGAAINWLSAFIVAKMFPTLMDAIGGGVTFWIVSLISLIAFIFVLYAVPETKGKTVAEIQEMLVSR